MGPLPIPRHWPGGRGCQPRLSVVEPTREGPEGQPIPHRPVPHAPHETVEAVALQEFSNTHPELCLSSSTTFTSRLSKLEERSSVLGSGSGLRPRREKGPTNCTWPATSMPRRGSWLPLMAPVARKPCSAPNPTWPGNEQTQEPCKVQIDFLPPPKRPRALEAT